MLSATTLGPTPLVFIWVVCALRNPACLAGQIARMWRFARSNGITERFHNRMETISRQAYGFRNFENYRQRVQV